MINRTNLRTTQFDIAFFPSVARVSGVTPDAFVVFVIRISTLVASSFSVAFGEEIRNFEVIVVRLVGVPTLTCATRSRYVQRSSIFVSSRCQFTFYAK